MITFCFGPIVQFETEPAQKWSPSQAQQRTTRTRHNVRTTDTCSRRGGHARVAPPPPYRMVPMLHRLPSLRLRVASSSGEAERSLSSLTRPSLALCLRPRTAQTPSPWLDQQSSPCRSFLLHTPSYTLKSGAPSRHHPRMRV
jgi:hypothetical protein